CVLETKLGSEAKPRRNPKTPPGQTAGRGTEESQEHETAAPHLGIQAWQGNCPFQNQHQQQRAQDRLDTVFMDQIGFLLNAHIYSTLQTNTSGAASAFGTPSRGCRAGTPVWS